MTSVPDWLVERAALDEVPPHARARVDRADPEELARRIATVRSEDAAELAAHPPGPAVAQLEARAARERARRGEQRARRIAIAGVAVAGAAMILWFGVRRGSGDGERTDHVAIGPTGDAPTERVKGLAKLLAFRKVGDQAERLDDDALVRPGDLIQLSYAPGGESHGMIASIDGAGIVTLHHPAREDAPPAATALANKTTALPDAYALDDAPQFERFFFITASAPVDVRRSLAALRALAQRADRETAAPELPANVRHCALLLRKPDPRSTTP